MDRNDEKKDGSDMERTGDVLGLGGSSVPKMPGDPSASSDPEAAARRRERAREEESGSHVSGDDDPYRPGTGATGIDMGSGGRGTDLSGE